MPPTGGRGHGRTDSQKDTGKGGVLILALPPTGSSCGIGQYPRFMAKKRGSVVRIICHLEVTGPVSWLWKQDMDSEPKELPVKPGRIQQTQTNSNATLIIHDAQFQDNGIYFCQHRCPDKSLQMGCGTELRVMGGCGACPPAGRGVGVGGATGVRPQPTPPSLPPVRATL